MVVDVLANDIGVVDPASVALVAEPKHGKATVDATTGAITYQPRAGYQGDDTFRYSVCDVADPPDCAEAEVLVTVGLPPTATVDASSPEPGPGNAGIMWAALWSLAALALSFRWRRARAGDDGR